MQLTESYFFRTLIDMSDLAFEGGCLCGAIRYRVSGQPLASGICHCRTCRRTSAAPMLPFVTFPFDRFEFARGKPVDFHSSPSVTRSFCGRCGTPLTYRHNEHPNEIDVMTCSLDDPEVFPPSHHLWLSQKTAWIHLCDDLAGYDTTRSAG